MAIRYINVTNKVDDINQVDLPNDFIMSQSEQKCISVLKVRLINSDGQLDVGCCLCGNFVDDSSYSYGIVEDFIMCTNEYNEKMIHVNANNLKHLKFYFTDYKGLKITTSDNYYYTLELKLIY